MGQNDHMRQTLEHFRQQKQAKLEEIRALDVTIRHLEKELGESSVNESVEFVMSSADIQNPPQLVGTSRIADVRPDEFFGMQQTEAAKAFLRKVRQAVSTDQLVDGLRRGGAIVGGADPKRTLYVSLMRNPKKEFVVVGDGFIGLREFYPHLPKTGIPRGATSGRTKKKVANKGKRPRLSSKLKERAKQSPITQTPEPPEQERLRAAVTEALKDGQLHEAMDIHKFVCEKLGYSVLLVKVHGTLRGKKFEKVEGKFRMKK